MSNVQKQAAAASKETAETVKRGMNGRTNKGILCSVLYVLAILILIWCKWSDFKALPLNELGDFFAGAFGPLAIFWLVLGYFQQGEELSISSQALIDQQEELRRQVEATARLASSFDRQAEASEELARLSREDRKRGQEAKREAARPSFRMHGGVLSENVITGEWINEGAQVWDLRFVVGIDMAADIQPADYVARNGKCNVRISMPLSNCPFNFSLEYRSELQERYVMNCIMHSPGNYSVSNYERLG